ncbi:MAG TPA: hypothetical protein VFS77_03880 [Pyrinomonadaceae bacterium]|nr:hypothetical protein [Pyrinomonadaceae bacterium]
MSGWLVRVTSSTTATTIRSVYGLEAVFRDNSGNWFSLTQPTAEAKTSV